tara:strand:- start:2244 stop:3623 length:1380 start_codon:yes stop_codon:yes gene_type:complete
MKSFHSFITEKKRNRNPGRPGGPGPSEAERAAAKGNTSKPNANPRRFSGPGARFRGPGSGLSVDDILTAVRPKGAAAAVGPEDAGVYIGSDKDAIKQAIDQERVGKQATHPVDAETTRQSGREKTGGRVKGDRPVGAQKPRSRFVKGQGYTIPTKGKRATRVPGGTGTSSGSFSKGTLKFSGDAKYRRLLRRLTTDVKPLPSGTGVRKEFKPEIKTEPTSKPRVVRGADTLAKPPKPPKPTTYRNLGIGPETAGRSLNIKGVRASNPVRAPRPQRYSNLGLGQERAGQRVVNRPVEIRVKSQPKTQLPKPPTSTSVADKVVQQMQDAAKKKSTARLKTLGRIGKGLGMVGAGLEAQGEYMRRKEDLGQDTTTAAKGAAARTGGGAAGAFAGGKLGAKLGSVLGPKGALVGGAAGSIYGYMVGADQATQAFDNAPKFNSKSFAKGLVDFASFRKKASGAK